MIIVGAHGNDRKLRLGMKVFSYRNFFKWIICVPDFVALCSYSGAEQQTQLNVCKALLVNRLEYHAVLCTLYFEFGEYFLILTVNCLNFLPLPFPITQYSFFSYQTIKQQLAKDKVRSPYNIIVRFKINVIKPKWNAKDLDKQKGRKESSLPL